MLPLSAGSGLKCRAECQVQVKPAALAPTGCESHRTDHGIEGELRTHSMEQFEIVRSLFPRTERRCVIVSRDETAFGEAERIVVPPVTELGSQHTHLVGGKFVIFEPDQLLGANVRVIESSQEEPVVERNGSARVTRSAANLDRRVRSKTKVAPDLQFPFRVLDVAAECLEMCVRRRR